VRREGRSHKRRRFEFQLDEELRKRIRRAMVKEGRVFMSEFVRSAILDKLEKLRV